MMVCEDMNFCYSDESGTGQEPIATMVGIVVDSSRMHLTKSDWNELLSDLSQMTGRKIVELHTADFYKGNGVWRGIDGPTRANIITAVLNWLGDRKHHVVYASVSKSSYFEAVKARVIPEEVHTLWRFLAFHLVLAIQKYSQPEKASKGSTVLEFDNEDREESRFIDLVLNPPTWSDDYYRRNKKRSQLDQIIDVPFFADSKKVPLLQVADFLAFFLRRHAEIQERLVGPVYEGEEEKISAWAKQLANRSIGRSHIYPKQNRNMAQEYFYSHAPQSIRDL